MEPADVSALSARTRLKPFGKLEPLSASLPWAVFPRKKLDVSYADIAAGLRACLQLREMQREALEDQLTRLWSSSPPRSGPSRCMVTLSVRTGFDLLLQTLKLPRGSEVLCSAVTIPDMLYILRHHGLVPVPVDLDPQTLAVDVQQLRAAVTQHTRMVLVAHIFGTLLPLDDVLEVARASGLVVVEDCAQAFAGRAHYTGDARADVSMFSFGTIKTATSFGGAVLRVNDAAVLDEMKRRERRRVPGCIHRPPREYPCRTNVFFFKRLVKYGFLHGLSTPAIYGLFLHACRAVGADHDKVITSAIRGFSGGELVSLIQYRPSMALLGLLQRRLTVDTQDYVALRKLKSEQLLRALEDVPHVQVPGANAPSHYFWLFPIVVPRPDAVVNYMNAHGFDVTSGATQLAFVPSPKGKAFDPTNAKHIMSSLVYLPITPETPEWAIIKMAQCLREALQSASRL